MQTVLASSLMALFLPMAAVAQTPDLSFEWSATFGASAIDNDVDSGGDPFEVVFDQASISGDMLHNYAQSGSSSTELSRQFQRYRSDVVDDFTQRGTFLGMSSGANDVLKELAAVVTYEAGEDASLDASMDITIDAVTSAASRLASTHPDSIVVLWTIPDLTYAPMFEGMPAAQVDSMRSHLERINAEIWVMDAEPNIVVVDIYAWLNDLAITPPVIHGVTVTLDELYVDDRHPNALGNALSANEIMRRLDEELGTSLPQLTEDQLAHIGGIP